MSATQAQPRQYSVLCIDDDVSSLTMRKMLLESVGLSAVTASSGKDGLAIFASQPVDAVLVDYSMPDMDGGIVATHMKRQKPHVPVIMLSGYSGALATVAEVVDAFVEKGGDSRDLLNLVQSLINIRSHTHPELTGDHIFYSDASRKVLDCSAGACHLLGYSRPEILGKTLDELSYKTQDAAGTFKRFHDHGSLQCEFVLEHKSGRPVLVHFDAWAFSDGCFAGIWNPVNDWKELYRAALLELNPITLKARAEVAVLAVHQRIREISLTASVYDGEQLALSDAINSLRVLHRELAVPASPRGL